MCLNELLISLSQTPHLSDVAALSSYYYQTAIESFGG